MIASDMYNLGAAYLKNLFFLFCALMPCIASAYISEGLSHYTFSPNQKHSSSFYIQNTQSIYKDAYNSAWAKHSVLVDDNDLYTLGAGSSFTEDNKDRNAFFIRYDWLFGDRNSLSFKWTFEQWRYIRAAKDSIGLEYNSFINFSKRGLYLSFGYYHRWLKQRWNKNASHPLNFDTKDHEGFFTFCLGWLWGNKENYWTFDINSRDDFSYYNLNNIAFDLNYHRHWAGNYIKAFVSVRTSGVLVGVGTYNQVTSGLGLLF